MMSMMRCFLYLKSRGGGRKLGINNDRGEDED